MMRSRLKKSSDDTFSSFDDANRPTHHKKSSKKSKVIKSISISICIFVGMFIVFIVALSSTELQSNVDDDTMMMDYDRSSLTGPIMKERKLKPLSSSSLSAKKVAPASSEVSKGSAESGSVRASSRVTTPKTKSQEKKTEEPKKVTLSSVGILQLLPYEQFTQTKQATVISLVISYCESPFSWILDYINLSNSYIINDVTIYSKCGKDKSKDPNSFQKFTDNFEKFSEIAPTRLVQAPNLGRCDHTYATWIVDHYLHIENDASAGDHLVFFAKDNAYHQNKFYRFDDVFTFGTQVGFGCVEKPVCDCDNKQCKEKKDIPLMLHKQLELDNFKMNTHNRMDRDKKANQGAGHASFKSERYKILKDWKDDMGFIIPHSDAIPVCYGGLFVAKKRNILKQPITAWQNVLTSLSRGNNIIEGHFAERLWAATLSGTDEDYARRVSEAILPRVHDTFWCWNRRGMMMVPYEQGYDPSVFPELI